jgi:hypothetical protein
VGSAAIIWLYSIARAEKLGADISKVRFREVAYPQMEDAIRQGNVDVALMLQPSRAYR